MKVILLALILFGVSFHVASGQWSNIYFYSDDNCDGSGAYAVVSSLEDACVGSSSYSCNATEGYVVESLFRLVNCKFLTDASKLPTETCMSHINASASCTESPELLPAGTSSFVTVSYQMNTEGCAEETPVIQYSSFPQDACVLGRVTSCNSTHATTQTYTTSDCSGTSITSYTELGCHPGTYYAKEGYKNYYCS